MPRLPDRGYLFIRSYLAEVWQTKRQAFSLISTTDQWYLQPVVFASVLAPQRRTDRTRAAGAPACGHADLPQCAGRALRHLANPKLLQAVTGSKRMAVYPLVRPHTDVGRLARAFLSVAQKFMAGADHGYPAVVSQPAPAPATPRRDHSRSGRRSGPATSRRRREPSTPAPGPDSGPVAARDTGPAEMLGHRLAADAPALRKDPHVVAGLVLLNYLRRLG
jgi:hypothetical protein